MTRVARTLVVVLGLIGIGTVALVAGDMSASTLTPVVFVLTACAWLSFVILGREAFRPPAIGALSERAVLAFVIALFGTIAAVLRANADAGLTYFDRQTAGLLFAGVSLAVLSVPTVWVVLYVLGWLGVDE